MTDSSTQIQFILCYQNWISPDLKGIQWTFLRWGTFSTQVVCYHRTGRFCASNRIVDGLHIFVCIHASPFISLSLTTSVCLWEIPLKDDTIYWIISLKDDTIYWIISLKDDTIYWIISLNSLERLVMMAVFHFPQVFFYTDLMWDGQLLNQVRTYQN